MSGMFKKAVGLALAFAIFAMCAVSAFAAQEKEPNDTIVTASTISVNTVVNGTTHSNDWVDWYKFTINHDGYVWMDFTHEYGEYNYDVELYSYDGYNGTSDGYNGTKECCLLRCLDYETNKKVSSANEGLAAGTYYILINSHDSYKTINYSIKVNFKATNDWEKEFNDSDYYTPNTISVGKTVYGSTHNDDDYDYYKFTLNQNGYVWIDFKHDRERSEHYIELYSLDEIYTNESIKYITFSLSDTDEKKSSSKQYLSAGTYYTVVKTYNSATTNYSFKVNFSINSGGGSSSGGSTAPSKTPNTQSTTTTTKYSTVVSSSDYINITADNNAQTYQSGNFYYYIDVNYNIVINNYSGSDTYVEIPSEINGKPVIGIADNAFAGTPAQIIYVPSSVSQFGQNAFGQDDGESREIMCEDGSYAQAYADSNGIANETVADKNEASSNAAAKKNKAEKKAAESKSKKLSTPMIIIICVAAAAIIAVVVVIIVMSRKKNEFEADNGFKYKQ